MALGYILVSAPIAFLAALRTAFLGGGAVDVLVAYMAVGTAVCFAAAFWKILCSERRENA